jgi:hypothetical protein
MSTNDGPPRAAIGCLMVPLGALSMAMVGVLISKLVAWATKAKCAVADIPTCDWYIYAGWGALFGAVTLPLLVTRRLGRAAPPENSKRG